MRRIAFFHTGFQLGGIEKSLYNLLSSNIFEHDLVDVYLFDKSNFYDISVFSSNINIMYLSSLPFASRFCPFDILKQHKIKGIDLSSEYDIAVDFSGYSQECAIGVYQIKAKKKAIWIHNDIYEKYREERKYRLLWHFFKSKFQYYNLYVPVSQGVADNLNKMINVTGKKVICAPNFISDIEVIDKSHEEINFDVDAQKYNLISSGRLCHQKGYDLLLNVVEQLAKKRTDFKVYILGNGPLKKKIQKDIQKKNLCDYVELLGAVRNPYSYMSKMDGYILMSRYEGQGLVLTEAKILGLDLFFPKRLEKYNFQMVGTEDIVLALEQARKKTKEMIYIQDYKEYVMECYSKVFEI